MYYDLTIEFLMRCICKVYDEHLTTSNGCHGSIGYILYIYICTFEVYPTNIPPKVIYTYKVKVVGYLTE